MIGLEVVTLPCVCWFCGRGEAHSTDPMHVGNLQIVDGLSVCQVCGHVEPAMKVCRRHGAHDMVGDRVTARHAGTAQCRRCGVVHTSDGRGSEQWRWTAGRWTSVPSGNSS